jgi:hypothetical protein
LSTGLDSHLAHLITLQGPRGRYAFELEATEKPEQYRGCKGSAPMCGKQLKGGQWREQAGAGNALTATTAHAACPGKMGGMHGRTLPGVQEDVRRAEQVHT